MKELYTYFGDSVSSRPNRFIVGNSVYSYSEGHNRQRYSYSIYNGSNSGSGSDSSRRCSMSEFSRLDSDDTIWESGLP